MNRLWLNRDPIGEAGGENLFRFACNSPELCVDPYGESTIVITLPSWAWPKTPNPVNLCFFGGAAAGTGLCMLFPNVMTYPGDWVGRNLMCPLEEYQGSEHTKGARPSTKGKHQRGQARKKRDAGGEKGDLRRPQPSPPRGKKPPKPLKPPEYFKGPKKPKPEAYQVDEYEVLVLGA